MGFLDLFRRKAASEPLTLSPEELRERLFAAAASGQQDTFAKLFSEYRAVIIEHFPAWQKVPESVRSDPAALQGYAQGLIGTAQLGAALGEPSLLQRLSSGAAGNPLREWQEGLAEARQLLDDGHFAEAGERLLRLEKAAASLQGSGVAKLLPYTLEFLAEARFHSGDAAGAVEPLTRALAICKDADDVEGMIACLGSLYEAARYLGEFDRAAEHADARAGLLRQLGKQSEAAHSQRMAERVRAGEPLLRVVLDIEGQRRELDEELGPLPERVQFIFERNRPLLRLAERLTQEGEVLASQGQLEKALAKFAEAERVDPFDPHSRYLAALALIESKRYGEALERYQLVERLAPGWFHSRADADLAAQLAAGALPHAAFIALRTLDDGGRPPAERLQLAEQAARTWNLAAAQLERTRALAALGRTQEALAACREGLASSTEPDIRSRLAVFALQWTDGAERAELLRVAKDPRGNLIAAAQARVIQDHRPGRQSSN